jgi:hypothetical protein
LVLLIGYLIFCIRIEVWIGAYGRVKSIESHFLLLGKYRVCRKIYSGELTSKLTGGKYSGYLLLSLILPNFEGYPVIRYYQEWKQEDDS